jgi:hypothetical protein
MTVSFPFCSLLPDESGVVGPDQAVAVDGDAGYLLRHA